MTTSPAKTPRRARVLRWALLATAALAAVTGNADVIGISQVGLAALQANHLVEPVLRADGKGWIIVGHVIVLRDANDRPILPNPRSYYMFRPLKGPFTPTDVNGNPDANAHEVRLAFAWTAQMDLAIASIDDVRGVISNRDLRYQSGAEALQALLAELDPIGEMHLKTAVPAVAYPDIVAREGNFSAFLLLGNMSATERQAEVASAAALAPEDPLSLNPLDPVLGRNEEADSIAYRLVLAAARCTRWGEPEAGLRDSCAAVLHFMCDTLYVEPADVPVGTRAKATIIRNATIRCRHMLINSVSNVGPQVLSRQPPRPYRLDGWPQVSLPDDPQPLNNSDIAKVCLEVLDACRTPRVADRDGVADVLLLCAANRADFRTVGKRPPLPEFAAGADDLGKRAFGVLVDLMAVPSDGSPDTGAYFRKRILNKLVVNDDPAVIRAAREATATVGVGNDSEIAPCLDFLFARIVDTQSPPEQTIEDVVYILHRMPAAIRDTNVRQHFQDEVGRRVAGMQESVAKAQAEEGTVRFVKVYGASP